MLQPRLHINVFIEKLISKHELTMLAQYQLLLGATNLRKAKKSVKAVNFPQDSKERTFRVYLIVVSFCNVFQKCISRQGFRLTLVLILKLISKFQARVLVKLFS